MRKRYGGKKGVREFFQRIGKTGGQNCHTGGFAADRNRAVESGRAGGSKSRRGYKFIKETPNYYIYINKTTNEKVRFKKG